MESCNLATGHQNEGPSNVPGDAAGALETPDSKIKAHGQQSTVNFVRLPHPSNQTLVERDEELMKAKNLIEHFILRNEITKRKLVDIFISGPPGSGKSELAIKLSETYINKFNIIYWLHADDHQILNNEITELFELLNSQNEVQIPTNKSIDLKFRWIGIWLQQRHIKCLLIYDNAQCFRNMSRMLPKHGSIFTIVTSQNDDWTQVSGLELRLEYFNENTVEEILCRELQVSTNLNMKNIAICLGGLPITVNIAIASLKQKNGVADYVSKLEEYSKDINEVDEIYKTLYTVLKNAFNIILKISHGILAIRIINIIAYTQNYQIPIKIFSNIDQHYHEALLLLKNFSLINYNENYVKINQQLQKILRYTVSSEKEIIIELFTILEKETVLNDGVMIFSDTKYSQHAMKAWSYICNYEDLIKRFINILFLIAQSTGRLSSTERNFFTQNLPVLETVLGWDNEILLQIHVEYAKLLYKGCESQKLEQIYDRVVSFLPDHLKQHKIVQQLLYWKAMSLCQQGIDFRGLSNREKIETALEIFQKLYEDCQDILSHEELMNIVNEMCKTSALIGNISAWNECLNIVQNIVRQMSAESNTMTGDLESLHATLNNLVNWHQVSRTFAISLCDTITQNLASEFLHHDIVLTVLDWRESNFKGHSPEANS